MAHARILAVVLSLMLLSAFAVSETAGESAWVTPVDAATGTSAGLDIGTRYV